MIYPLIDENDALEITPNCGALNAVLVIGGLTMSGILIAAVVIFRGLRKIVGVNGNAIQSQ